MKKLFALVLMLMLLWAGNTLALTFDVRSVRAEPLTQVAVATQPIQQVGLPFTANVTVTNVTNLYAWQIQIFYFPSIINWTTASIPTENIFQGKQTVGEIPPIFTDLSRVLKNITAVDLANPLNPPTQWNWTIPHGMPVTMDMKDWMDSDGTGTLSASDIVWMDSAYVGLPTLCFRVAKIETASSVVRLTAELAYVMWGASLIGPEIPASGSGALCQLTFAALSPGFSILDLSRIDTFLWDADLNDIPSDLVNASVTVRSYGHIRYPGDINDDGKVDIEDIAVAAVAFGSYTGHPRWNPDADVNEDNKINIIDLVMIAKKFGWTE